MMDTDDKSSNLINLDHLFDLAAGDKDFVKEMIEYYLSQVPVVSQDLHKYQEQKDWFALGEIAHKAKSSFKFMGIQQLADQAKELEDICREQPDERRINDLLTNIEALMIPSSEQLRLELAKIDTQ
jgi:HPt (histidine-containing phosphotransfer) domain-containing protein